MGVITYVQGLCIHKFGMDSPPSKTWRHPDHGDTNGIYMCETQQSIRYQQMPHLPLGVDVEQMEICAIRRLHQRVNTIDTYGGLVRCSGTPGVRMVDERSGTVRLSTNQWVIIILRRSHV
jgi:hypothetical protein